MSIHSDDQSTGGDVHTAQQAGRVGGRAVGRKHDPSRGGADGLMVFGEQHEMVDLGMFSGALVDWIAEIAAGGNDTP